MSSRAVIVCAMFAAAVALAQQPEQAVRQQVVDVRDLSAALEDTRLQMIVGRIAESVDVSHDWLDDGLLLIQGPEAEIGVFNGMLSDMRTLYDQTYSIELRVIEVDVADLPAMGAPVDTDAAPLYITRQTVTRRVSTGILSEQRRSFVADVQPVVGDQSVGFDPDIAEAVSASTSGSPSAPARRIRAPRRSSCEAPSSRPTCRASTPAAAASRLCRKCRESSSRS